MIFSRFFLSGLTKRVDDLHEFWNLHVSAVLVLAGAETKALMQCLETHSEICVGVSKETVLQEIARQGQATRL